MIARQQIPNLLTFARVLAVPATLVVMLTARFLHPALFWIFLFASLTDFMDGYLARKWKAESALGALLDPIADKLLVGLLLLYLLSVGGMGIEATTHPLFIPVVVILLREIYISGLREFLAARGYTLPVSKAGKLKTALQMIAILLLLAPGVFGGTAMIMAGYVLLCVAALVAFVSAALYTRAALKLMR
jgi:CDP-diacylglycerol--glycerol-3-phosphate 3-phosphatidyltransferase